MLMTTTQINLDDEALAEAAKILGTRTKVDTVNEALRFIVRRQRQLESIEWASQTGIFDNLPKGDEAWH
jgi:Arc/MetJ family transcription regulator